MDSNRPQTRWFRFAAIWAIALAGIWWSAANITLKFAAVDHESVYRKPQFRLVSIDDPQPPTRDEIISRGTFGTVFAVLAWAYIRYSMRRDKEVDANRHKNRHKNTDSHVS